MSNLRTFPPLLFLIPSLPHEKTSRSLKPFPSGNLEVLTKKLQTPASVLLCGVAKLACSYAENKNCSGGKNSTFAGQWGGETENKDRGIFKMPFPKHRSSFVDTSGLLNAREQTRNIWGSLGCHHRLFVSLAPCLTCDAKVPVLYPHLALWRCSAITKSRRELFSSACSSLL